MPMKHILCTLTGTVVKGDGYGQRLGFPTANLDRRDYARKRKRLKLHEGIYVGTASLLVKDTGLRIKDSPFKAALVLGPKDKTGLPKIEAHLLDFNGVLYGTKLRLSFMKYLRPFIIFDDEEKLKEQIKSDLSMVRQFLDQKQTGVYF